MKVIRSVVLNPDSVEVQYMDFSDVRLEGAVFVTHNLTVARGGDHDDEIAAVEDAVTELLTDVLSDWARSMPYEPTVPVQDDDDDD